MRQTEPYRAVATPTPIVALRGRARCLITARTHEDPFICASRLLHEESRYGSLASCITQRRGVFRISSVHLPSDDVVSGQHASPLADIARMRRRSPRERS